jgi:hypothetical protein
MVLRGFSNLVHARRLNDGVRCPFELLVDDTKTLLQAKFVFLESLKLLSERCKVTFGTLDRCLIVLLLRIRLSSIGINACDCLIL